MLTLDDCYLILESLEYTRQAFTRYSYPDETIRAMRLQDVQNAIDHVRALRNSLKGKGQ
jgi:hypothetical protein